MWTSTATRHALLAVLLATPAACATVIAAADRGAPVIDDGRTFALHPGQTVTLADRSALRYLRVLTDSRCPPGVQCIWAGDAEVQFEWLPAASAAIRFSLHTGKEPRQTADGERTLSLISLARGDAPEAQLRVDRIR